MKKSRKSSGETPFQRLERTLEEAWRSAGEGVPRRLIVLTHRVPDPDALGACEGVRRLCTFGLGFDAEVATVGPIRRAENLAMVRILGIQLAEYGALDPRRFASGLLVDTQPGFGHTVLPDDVPILAVLDHHVSSRAEGRRRTAIPHEDVRPEVGATSSIVYEYLRDAGVELDPHTASALFCGVRYDTADLSRNASALDEEAYYETFRRADRRAIAQIQHSPLDPGYYRELGRALSTARRHGPFVVALLGRTGSPEFVAEMADFLLRMEGVRGAIVGGAYEDEYVLSVRTGLASGEAFPWMERLIDGQGTFGGHGHVAGGRIPIAKAGRTGVGRLERSVRRKAIDILRKSAGNAVPRFGKPIV